MPADTVDNFDSLFRLYATIGAIVGALVLAWLFYALARFRAKKGAAPPADAPGLGAPARERGRGLGIYVMALAIAGILFALAFGTISSLHFIERPPTENTLRVRVTGFQFGWQFEYPQGVKSLNDLTVPSDTNVVLDVTSRDVVHKFQLSAYRIGVDATPGRTNTIWFHAGSPGVVEAWCAELCGAAGHYLMRATVTILAAPGFAAWLTEHAGGTAGPPVQTLELALTDTGVDPARPEAVVGADVHLHVTNHGTAARTLHLGEPYAASVPEVAPGAGVWLNGTVPETWLAESNATRTVALATTDGALHGGLVLVRPAVVQVTLSEWKVDVGPREVPSGVPVLFRIANHGQAMHDFSVGAWATKEEEKRIDDRSPTIDAGQAATLLAWFPTAGTFDVWCNVPGHAQMGMRSTIEVKT